MQKTEFTKFMLSRKHAESSILGIIPKNFVRKIDVKIYDKIFKFPQRILTKRRGWMSNGNREPVSDSKEPTSAAKLLFFLFFTFHITKGMHEHFKNIGKHISSISQHIFSTFSTFQYNIHSLALCRQFTPQKRTENEG